MKINFLVLLAFLMTTLGVQAQHANIGVKGGLNAYNIQGTNSSENDFKLGFHVGLLSHFHIGEQFGLQPEITFSTQGTRFNNSGSKSDLNLNYINVPVLFQYMFNNGFRIEAGPQLGILASAKYKYGNNNDDVKESFKGTDLGLTLGMSYVKVETGLGFDVRYNHGFTDINKNTEDNSEFKSFNRGFQIGVFYLFQHKS